MAQRGRLIRAWWAMLICTLTAMLSASLSPAAEGPQFVALIREASPAVFAMSDEHTILGSGFRVASTRYAVTAAHIARVMRGQPIVVWQGQRLGIRLVSADDSLDIAVFEFQEEPPMPGLALASDNDPIDAGQWIVVLGCPFGVRPIATVGIVSALPGAVLEPVSLRARMQLNAAINPGNSGGPVLNLAGAVVGMASDGIPGGYGLGFAVPATTLRRMLDQLAPK